MEILEQLFLLLIKLLNFGWNDSVRHGLYLLDGESAIEHMCCVASGYRFSSIRRAGNFRPIQEINSNIYKAWSVTRPTSGDQ